MALVPAHSKHIAPRDYAAELTHWMMKALKSHSFVSLIIFFYTWSRYSHQLFA